MNQPAKAPNTPTKSSDRLSARRFSGLWPVLIAFALAAIPFIAGKYIEFNVDDPFDSALNVYHAKCIVDGQKIGESIQPSARPATLLVNVIGVSLFGYSELGPKCIQMLLQLAALVLMFFTLRKLYGPLPALAALILAAFYLSCPPFAKYGNVKEQFMIAFMIIAACALMQRHLGGSWWWLVLSGAAAVNIYFFKPTGVSVIIAMIIFLLVQPIIRRRKWSQTGSDIVGLLVGGLIGFLPLMIFYFSQGQLLVLLKSFPLVKQIIIASKTNAGSSGSVVGGYVAASRSVSSFAAQFDTVMRYYNMLIVPIGFSLLAAGSALVVWSRRWRCKATSAIEKNDGKIQSEANTGVDNQEAFVLFFSIWWILDMLFIWISPRSYVQYYLPLNASAAMLTAYVLYRARKQALTFIWLMGVWILLKLLLTWPAPAETFPYITIRTNGPEDFWSGWAIQWIPLAIALCVYLFANQLRRSTRTIMVALACGYALLSWSAGNVEAFKERVGNLQKKLSANQVDPWKQIGQAINKNSEPDDGLYVWGWYPGLYVAAQRFCPAMQPAYSDMHTDSPKRVAKKIRRLLKDFEAKAPRFIMDSQKMHYPYNTHPVFQLWPTGKIAEDKVGFIDPVTYRENRGQFMERVENYTFQALRLPNRPGGPLAEEQARRMARTERQRHEAMEPLRDYVMKQYQPVVPANSPMMLFRLKEGPVDSQ